MSAVLNTRIFTEIFVTLIVITDPLGIIPLFLSLTSGHTSRVQKRSAWQAAVVSLGIIVGFALFGQVVLEYLGVEIPALQASGGLLLLLVALQLLTGQQEEPTEQQRRKANVAMVPLGTPLLAGPGAIVATILYVQRAHTFADYTGIALGIVAVHVVLWLAMRFSVLIIAVIKDNGVELVTRIAGLLLAAIAVEMVAQAVRAFIRAG
ncbi:MAG TPA: MarC family protein [Streptosporangiaceae bacterium]